MKRRRRSAEDIRADRAITAAYKSIRDAPTEADRITRIKWAADSGDPAIREWARTRWRVTLQQNGWRP